VAFAHHSRAFASRCGTYRRGIAAFEKAEKITSRFRITERGSMILTPACSKSMRLRVTTVKSWTSAVAAIRLSLMGIAHPAMRRLANSCVHLKPVFASHAKQRSLWTPASNHRSRQARLLPLRSRRMPKRNSRRMIGSTTISRSFSRSPSTTLESGTFLVGSLRTLASTTYFHSVSVDAESIGTKKPFSGQASSQ